MHDTYSQEILNLRNETVCPNCRACQRGLRRNNPVRCSHSEQEWSPRPLLKSVGRDGGEPMAGVRPDIRIGVLQGGAQGSSRCRLVAPRPTG